MALLMFIYIDPAGSAYAAQLNFCNATENY